LRSISQKKQQLKSELNHISTIIFDLGGVVLNLDSQRSLKSFAKYSGLSEKDIYAMFIDDNWSYAFERGEISAATFRNEVRKSLKTEHSDQQIDDSWNAMLLDLPPSRLTLLAGLRNRFKTMVLSNTNDIHIVAFDKIVANATNGGTIDDFFDKIYYSHILGMRKPETEIYKYVIKENNLDPAATLFIDDMEKNIAGAQSCGLKTLHLTNQDYLFELFG